MSDPVARLNTALEGRYCIERELGEGGMATVYLADDLRHERKVALKVLKPELAAVVGADRFLAEIKTTANLQHPHVLPLFDSGAADGFLFFVMPYVEGESLRQRLDREKQLPVEDAVRIVTGVASGLHYAHQRGVVHRDVKPANVMLTGGMPVVADFGISLAMSNAEDSRLTGTGLSIGTPDYMSPEQATGDGELDARSDLYALGCMLYEMLTGDPPHAASTAQALIARRLTVPPTPVRTLRPTVPVHIEEALRRALEVVPADRHPSLEAFSRALSDGATPEPFPRLELTAPSTPVAPPETPFVGREKERTEILERLDQLSEGRGSLVLVGGEPGVGKTRLSELVLDEGRKRGYMCLVGHAYELEGTPPFTPLIEQLEYVARIVPAKTFRAVLGDAAPEVARIVPALRRLFPDIGPGIELPPDQQRQHLFHRYREFAERAAQVQPLVLLFDDLHWADEATLLLLEHLAQHLHEMPTLALGTYRDVELEVGRPFAASLERLLRQHRAHRIALRRLPSDEVTELLHKLGGSAPPRALAHTIYHETEGNPFFVQEVFRHLNEEGRLFDAQGSWRSDITAEELDVPEGVRLVVGRRLQRVSEECRKVLTTASVVGPRFALSVLDAVGDVEEDDLFDALDEAEGAHLVVSKGGRRDPMYGFTHELIRQTLIDTLSFPRRQRLHLKISKALEQAYGERIEEHAADLAHHLYHAGAAADPDKTLRFLRVAGEQALDGSGYEEALAQFDRALSLEEDVPEDIVPVLLEGKTKALDGMGRWNDVIDVGKRAMELYLAGGDAESAARVAALVTYRMLWWTRVEEIVDTARSVLDVLPEEPSRARIRLLANLGAALNVLDEPGSLESIERAISDARALGDESALIHPTLTLGLWHLSRGHATESLLTLGEVLALTERSNDESWRSQALAFRLPNLPSAGRIDDALSAADEADALGKERGDVGAELQAHLARIVVGAMKTGDGVELEAQGRDFIERFHQAGPWRNYGLTLAGLGAFWQGDLDEALVLFDRAVEVLHDRTFSGWPRGWRFMLSAYAGRADARSLYRAVEPELFRPGGRSRPGNLTALHAAIQGLAFLGDVEAVASHYPGAEESLGFGTVADFAALWQCSTGVAAACAEKWDAGEEHFATALRQADEIPYVMAGFDTRRWYAWALLRRGAAGDQERACELLEEAITGYRKLSARFLERIATELLEGIAS